MKKLKISSMEVKGRFTFEPLNLLELTRLICDSEISNKGQLLQALWWPKSYLTPYDEFMVSDSEYLEKVSRNMMRDVNIHIQAALNPEIQGREKLVQYEIFSFPEEFGGFNGYLRAIDRVKLKGLSCANLMWFISLVLQMPKELKHLGFAAPTIPSQGNSSIYPYFISNQLWFSECAGDPWMDDELTYINRGLLFGVKTLS